jgi:deferrochelatase/peroxidase EfeB
MNRIGWTGDARKCRSVRRVPVHERGPKRTYRPDMTPPSLHGEHPPGIAGPHLRYGKIGAFEEPDLEAWTRLAEELMPEITVTIGLGPAFFTRDAPVALRELPPFAGDDLDPRRTGGKACVLLASDQPIDVLTRFGTPRWTREGEKTPNGALGFRDGTMNPRRPLDLDRHVWVTTRDRTEMLGGTYLVVRDIEIRPTWSALARDEQERVIGRDKESGAPLGGSRLFEKPQLATLPEQAHIRQASPRMSGVTILRRGYDTDTGLLFLAFMKDPRRQFVPLQRRLSVHDALHVHTRTRGSAVFAVPRHPLLYAQ